MIELLVVCGIMVVISALILVNHNKFGGAVTLENLAYDVALSVRQTQVYGIAVERFGSSNFSTGYGQRFSLSSPTSYILFADEDGTGVYDANASPSEIVQSTTLNQGYAISSMCVIAAAGGSTCSPVSEIDVLYKRPEPTAYISAGANGSAPTSCPADLRSGACYYEAQITLEAPRGDTRIVVIDATGQISVQQPGQ